MEVPAEISEQLVGLQAALDALEEVLQPFLDMKPREMDTKLAPLERAQAHLLLAQTVGQLFKVHLQLRGQRPEEHPIHKDLERLGRHEKKLAQAAGKEQLARSRRGTTVNVEAAARVINATAELSAEQKAQLKQLGEAATAKRAADALQRGERHKGKQQKREQREQAAAVPPASRQREAEELLQLALAEEDPGEGDGQAGGGQAQTPASSSQAAPGQASTPAADVKRLKGQKPSAKKRSKGG